MLGDGKEEQKVKDVIVVGSGFWGAAIARKLNKAGMDYTVIDDGHIDSGTRNSGAYTCMRWFSSGTIAKQIPDDWTKQRIEKWVNWLINNKYLEPVGQWVYNKSRDTWKRYDDCYLMKDVSAFSNKTKHVVQDSVVRIKDGRDCVVYLKQGTPIKAKYIVLAAGVWTDEILKNSRMNEIGVESLNGRALLIEPTKLRNDVKWDKEVISVNVRPFKNYDLLKNSKNWWYFGATTEKPESEKAYDEMLGAAQLLFGGSVNIKKILLGRRPVYNGGVVKVTDRIISATGGGRIGLALAGPAAEDVVNLINNNENSKQKAIQ